MSALTHWSLTHHCRQNPATTESSNERLLHFQFLVHLTAAIITTAPSSPTPPMPPPVTILTGIRCPLSVAPYFRTRERDERALSLGLFLGWEIVSSRGPDTNIQMKSIKNQVLSNGKQYGSFASFSSFVFFFSFSPLPCAVFNPAFVCLHYK